MPADVGIRHPNHFLGAGCAHLGEKLRHPKQRTANGHSKVETMAIPLHVNGRCTASGEVEVCLNHTKLTTVCRRRKRKMPRERCGATTGNSMPSKRSKRQT